MKMETGCISPLFASTGAAYTDLFQQDTLSGSYLIRKARLLTDALDALGEDTNTNHTVNIQKYVRHTSL